MTIQVTWTREERYLGTLPVGFLSLLLAVLLPEEVEHVLHGLPGIRGRVPPFLPLPPENAIEDPAGVGGREREFRGLQGPRDLQGNDPAPRHLLDPLENSPDSLRADALPDGGHIEAELDAPVEARRADQPEVA